MTNRAQELIKNFYEEEALRKESEVTFADLSIRLNSSDIAMLEIISKRFGRTSDRVAADALSAAIYSMVEALETTERKQLAKEADEFNESLSKKAAKSNGMADYDEKSVTWTMNDRAITRDENKRKKEQEEAQPTSQPAIATPSSEPESEPVAAETALEQEQTYNNSFESAVTEETTSSFSN
ncbi:hypothetical protein [Reinekea sp.]|jgi:hypothetical protein|uniref:hypothetical protein n=1 Tax=Reinekea sp. TaxID=1970455 RepID=UPI003989124F